MLKTSFQVTKSVQRSPAHSHNGILTSISLERNECPIRRRIVIIAYVANLVAHGCYVADVNKRASPKGKV